MKYDIVLAGVGGQGVLSVAAVIGRAAMAEGFHVKQSEVHGMSQRGGAVVAHLRISDRPVASDLIPRGSASLVLSMEPIEGLRYLEYLAPEGTLVTSTDPVENIPNYPDVGALLARMDELPRAIRVESEHLAKRAGSPRTVNMVLVGAASRLLPVGREALLAAMRAMFAAKGEKVVEENLRAFDAGREAAV